MKKKNPMDEAQKETHPSYGAITIGRISSGQAHPMYGSSVKHRDTIRLTVHHGERKRVLSGDWYSAGATIVEVEMTQNQWAELVSSVGCGAGVPCTIKWLGGNVEPCPFTSKVDQFRSEFKDLLSDAAADADDAIAKATELLGKKSLTKTDRQDLLDLLRSISASIKSSAPFVFNRFVEQMEKTSTEVKGELEAWQLNKMAQFAAIGMASQPDAPPMEFLNVPPETEEVEEEVP